MLARVYGVVDGLRCGGSGDSRVEIRYAGGRQRESESETGWTRGASKEQSKDQHLRVLVNKLGDVVDLVVDHDVKILLGVVLRHILVGKLLGSHLEDCVVFCSVFAKKAEFWTAVTLAQG